jgi:hypothetical protein
LADSGALQLQALGRRFKTLAGYQNLGAAEGLGSGRSLRAQLLAGIRVGTKPMVDAARQAARDELPKHGGLNEYVASSLIGTYTRTTGPQVGIRIGVRKGAGSHKAWGANKGLIRHPVFARGDLTRDRWRWVDQKVPAGWFDDTLRKATPASVEAVTKTCELIAAELTMRGV